VSYFAQSAATSITVLVAKWQQIGGANGSAVNDTNELINYGLSRVFWRHGG